MAKDRINNETDWAAVAARAQAYLCLDHAGLREKGLTEQAKFLMNLGLSRADAAAMLGSTDDSLRIMFGRAVKSAPKPAVRVAKRASE